MPSEPTQPRLIGTWRQGRYYCPRCNVVATVVRDVDVELVCCPTCGEVCTAAGGYDNLR